MSARGKAPGHKYDINKSPEGAEDAI